MKKSGKTNRLRRNIVLGVLLAVLCIGSAELVACRFFEPELYERIVAPARYAASVVVDAGRAGLNAAGRFCQDVGNAVSRFAVQTGERAAALWEELTAPNILTVAPTPSEAVSSDDPDATSPPYTQLKEVDGKQILTGGSLDVTYFCQSDEAWADQPYGTDTIGPYGCGPTVMAIAVASMTDTDTDPAAMAQWAVDNGQWARRSGSYHSIILETARNFGIMAEPFTTWEVDNVLDTLRQGKVLIALVGPGHFTDGGHFILLRGAAPTGQVLIADPNSLENSLQLWDPQIILDELSSARDNGAPIWVLWTPDQ